jgi:hypothetical protein
MKKQILLLFVSLFFTGCDTFVEMDITNSAEYPISFCFPAEYPYLHSSAEVPYYPDTILRDLPQDPYMILPKTVYEYVLNSYGATWFREPLEMAVDDLYEDMNADTISWFILKKIDSTNSYIRDEDSMYNVIQRYDLSKDDLYKIAKRNIFSFPPTEAMKGYKMWPPYGTYDEKGNKVRDY